MKSQNQSQAFADYRRNYLEELLPEGHTESDLAEQFIFASFQLDRVREVEKNQELESDLGSFGNLLNLARYRSSLERTRDRAHKLLREVQNERFQRNAPYEAPTNRLPPFVKSALLRRTRMEYAFDNQVDPHIPEVWPYASFAKRLPPSGYNTSTVDYPPTTVFERENPFPQPPLHILERQLKRESEDKAA